MRFSIIIPTYNGLDRIGACLSSIAAQDFPKDEYEVIVVDDCSTQDVKSAIEKTPPPRVAV